MTRQYPDKNHRIEELLLQLFDIYIKLQLNSAKYNLLREVRVAKNQLLDDLFLLAKKEIYRFKKATRLVSDDSKITKGISEVRKHLQRRRNKRMGHVNECELICKKWSKGCMNGCKSFLFALS